MGEKMHTPDARCSFARAGTYGHECGSVATKVGIRKSDLTKTGIYYARRCDVCAAYKGGENAGISEFVLFNPSVHVNQFY